MGGCRVASVLHQHLRDLSTAATHYELALARPDHLQAEWHVQYMAGNAYLTLGYQVMPHRNNNETQSPTGKQRGMPLRKEKNVWQYMAGIACLTLGYQEKALRRYVRASLRTRLLLHACSYTPAPARQLLHACVPTRKRRFVSMRAPLS